MTSSVIASGTKQSLNYEFSIYRLLRRILLVMTSILFIIAIPILREKQSPCR